MYLLNMKFKYKVAPVITSIDDLPAYSQHNLTIAGGIRHQVQHLLVRTSLHHHTINANELISSSQTSILLCSSVWHNSPDVHLGKYILMEKWKVEELISLLHQPHFRVKPLN